ncbi:YhgE/Pip family protein [Clostridium neuense]|uniref:YhgE/Pip family protein n=1 Tax=Clostridium neuense TaxID=1728934 RepID=A0ABW8TJK6_9CLOT
MEQKESKFTKSFLWKIIAIITCAIMFIPMMYSLFYLGAFWDPYGNLKNVPVAFVNLDEPYNNDGKSYTLGKDLEKKLKDNDSFKWEFVGYNKAKEGVDNTSYYAMIVIPKDFSKKLANSTNGNFEKPQIIYRANKGRNFIFSLLSQKGAESIQSQITNSISKETTKTLVDKLYDVKDSLKDASDAQDKIQDGTQKLFDGSGTLATNLVSAFDGSNKLKTGLNQLTDGSKQLNDGLGAAYNGSNALGNGLGQLAQGQKKVVGGLSDLDNGLTQFKAAINQTDGKMDQLVKGSDQLNEGAKGLNGGVDKLNKLVSGSLDQAASGLDSAASYADTAEKLLDKATAEISIDPEQAKKDIAAAKQITDIIKQGNTSISSKLKASKNVVSDNLSKPVSTLGVYTSQIADGVKQARSSTSDTIDKLLNGTRALEAGSGQVNDGLTTVASKTNDLTNGLGKLSNGSSTLMTGLNTAASSTGTLASGLGQLSDGAKTLNSNLGTLNDGTKKLKDGLNDGYDKINNNLKFTSNAMSKFVSNPVNLSDQSINDVKKYGEGLAPYFISLSLWLGAMFINLVLTLIDKLKLADNKFYNNFLGKYAVGVVLVTIQAIVLAISLNAGLGLDAIKTPYLYLNNIFTSIVFFSVMYGLSAAFGIMSTPISFVLLILQLSSCAGTFPIETSPVFYRVVNTFIPMTYTVNVVRMILSGINHSGLMQNISILLTFMFTFLIGGFLIKTLREKISKQLISKQSAETAA